MLPTPASTLQFRITRNIDADLATVFDTLTSEAGMKRWIPLCRSAEWRHPAGMMAPGKGSVRYIVLHGRVLAAERMLAWVPGRELHYGFDQTTLPVAGLTRGYVGVTRLEPAAGSGTRLIWDIHFDAPGLLALSLPVVRASLQPLIARMATQVQRVAEAR